MAFVILGICIGGGEAITAYDCEHPRLSESYSMLAVKHCREADPDIMKITKEALHLYEAPTTRELSVKTCKVMVAYYIAYCGSASHNSLVDFDQYPSPEIVTAEQCELFHATRTMSMDGSTIMLKVNSTTQFKTFKAGSTSQDGTCEQENFIHNGKSYKKVFVIANYAVTLVETKIVFSRLCRRSLYRMPCARKEL